MTERHSDDSWPDLAELDVVCPRCGRPAKVFRAQFPSKLSCLNCGHSETRRGKVLLAHGSQDYNFRCEFLFQADFRGNAVWGGNRAHVLHLRDLLVAKLRERHANTDRGWHNRSFGSRLPAWLKSAKHRDELVKLLDRLALQHPDVR